MKPKIILGILIVILSGSTSIGQYPQHDNQMTETRIFNKKEYQVRDTGFITIYSRDVPRTKVKKMVETHTETIFYFSKTADSDIFLLTITNIERAFPTDHQLHYKLMQDFQSDNALTVYDDFHKTYKVNRFLQQYFWKQNNKK